MIRNHTSFHPAHSGALMCSVSSCRREIRDEYITTMSVLAGTRSACSARTLSEPNGEPKRLEGEKRKGTSANNERNIRIIRKRWQPISSTHFQTFRLASRSRLARPLCVRRHSPTSPSATVTGAVLLEYGKQVALSLALAASALHFHFVNSFCISEFRVKIQMADRLWMRERSAFECASESSLFVAPAFIAWDRIRSHYILKYITTLSFFQRKLWKLSPTPAVLFWLPRLACICRSSSGDRE